MMRSLYRCLRTNTVQLMKCPSRKILLEIVQKWKTNITELLLNILQVYKTKLIASNYCLRLAADVVSLMTKYRTVGLAE